MAIGGTTTVIGTGIVGGSGVVTAGTLGAAAPATAVTAAGGGALAMYGGAITAKALSSVNSEGEKSSGRGSNHLKPDPEAQAAHSIFRTEPKTGKTTNIATYEPNPKNPKTGFDETKRVDVGGASHRHSKTGQEIKTPHTHLPKQKDPVPSTKEEFPKQ